MKKSILGLTLLTIAQLLTGCFGEANHHAVISPAFVAQPGTRIELATVSNDTGQQFDFDIAAELRTQLQLELERQHLDFPNGSTGPRLILQTHILDYEKGNAAGRWFQPGLGGTRLMIKANLTTASGDEVGTESVIRSVETGGIYSIGEWKKIFHAVAKDVVSDLKSKLSMPKPSNTTPEPTPTAPSD
jgi:hypothetical protein